MSTRRPGVGGPWRNRFAAALTSKAVRALLVLYPRGYRREVGFQLRRDLGLSSSEKIERLGVIRWTLWLLRALCSLAWNAPGVWRELAFPEGVRSAATLGDALLQDLRYGVRQLLAAPVLTVVGSASMAVGVAMAAGVFSIFDALLEPLPVPNPASVHHLLMRVGDSYVIQPHSHEEIFERSGAFSGLAAESLRHPVGVTLPDGDVMERAHIGFVSPDYFDVLRLPLVIGRPPAEGERGIVLAHQYWRRRLGEDPDVLGSVLRVNGAYLSVTGVALRGFVGVFGGQPPVGWTTVDLFPEIAGSQRGHFHLVGRLAPGVSAASATQRTNALAAALATEDPDWRDRVERGYEFPVVTHRQSVAPPGQREELLGGIAFGGSLVVLLLVIVCTNVTGLLLARALGRRHEISVRVALGATRGRLLAQLLIESFLLALLGAFLGLIALTFVLDLIGSIPDFGSVDLQLNARVVLVALVVSVVCALASGAAPTLHALGTNVREGMTARGSAGSSKVRGLLNGAQVCVSCVLIVLAVSTARAVTTQMRSDPGFPIDGLIALRLGQNSLPGDSVAFRAHVRELETLIAASGRVRSVARAARVPFGAGFSGYRLSLESSSLADLIQINPVEGEYFSTLGVRVLAGRAFSEADETGSAPVAVVNREFTRVYPAFSVGSALNVARGTYEIVGVVENVPYWGAPETFEPLVYLPVAYADAGVGLPASAMLIAGPPGQEVEIVMELQRRIQFAFPSVTPPVIQPLREIIEQQADDARILSRVALIVGAVELILAAVGLYGLLLFALVARTRELGVRMALGAAPEEASRAVLWGGLRPAFLGAGIGLVLAFPVVQVAGLVFPAVQAVDGVPFLAAMVATLVAALSASIVPSLRAARVAPTAALRHE